MPNQRSLFTWFTCPPIVCVPCLAVAWGLLSLACHATERPNILWITSEDNGPHLGCYGDAYATTPHLDDLAARSLMYRFAWSTAPVCAPARTALITGLYPQSLGAQHMRSMVPMPDSFKMFPQYLREAGYYCSNNSKEDYNVPKPGRVWDESSKRAHWRNRAAEQPFFAVFNFTMTHESQIRKRPHTAVHDPAEVPLPVYHPDTPEVRQDWAQYYDKMTEMDRQVGRVLDELRQDNLTDETIVFYFADHGSGMPRSKRWPYNSGLQVPLIVHIPDQLKSLAADDYRPGGSTKRLVSFVDFAPTVLSLAGIRPPAQFQGHAFLGPHDAGPQPVIHGFRGRMDERYDMVRSVRDERYIYVRNYLPNRIYGQHVAYMFQTPTTQVWHQMFQRSELNDVQGQFWNRKPAEELYDLNQDPDEVHNLAGSPEYAGIKKRLRRAQRELIYQIRDLGFLPEGDMQRRAGNRPPYEMARSGQLDHFEAIVEAAEHASLRPQPSELKSWSESPDAAARYWQATGMLIGGKPLVKERESWLLTALNDPCPEVCIVAVESLLRYGSADSADEARQAGIDVLQSSKAEPFVAMALFNALANVADEQLLGELLEVVPDEYPGMHRRYSICVPRLVEQARRQLTSLSDRR